MDDEVAENLHRPLLHHEAHLAAENEQLGLVLSLQHPLALLERVQQGALRVELLFSSQQCFVSQTRQRQSCGSGSSGSAPSRIPPASSSSWRAKSAVPSGGDICPRRAVFVPFSSTSCPRAPLPSSSRSCGAGQWRGQLRCFALRVSTTSASVAPFSAVRSRKQPSPWPPAWVRHTNKATREKRSHLCTDACVVVVVVVVRTSVWRTRLCRCERASNDEELFVMKGSLTSLNNTLMVNK